MYVLRRSFGAWSAGTEVYEHDGEFQIGAREVPAELVVKRRERSMLVPKFNRKERRRREREAKKSLGI